MTNDFDLLRLVGNTPLVEVRHLNPNRRVKVLAKLESHNPGGSIKDRPAFYMIERAEERGELTRGKIILEATSGNTGIGLATVAAVKGYRLLLAMRQDVLVHADAENGKDSHRGQDNEGQESREEERIPRRAQRHTHKDGNNCHGDGE